MTASLPTPNALSSTITLYLLANNASTRLTTEAHRPDLHLRRMVGHANMLDRLTTELNARENALYDIPTAKSTPSHRAAASAGPKATAA
jgi:hypothetical protein